MDLQSCFNKYVDLGWTPFSLRIHWDTEHQKKALIPPKNWQKIKNSKKHFDSGANAIALRTGQVSCLFLLDIDDNAKFKKYLEKNGFVLPTTMTAITGSGGRHYYFMWTSELAGIKSNSKVLQLDGEKIDVDIRSDGGMIIAPPSRYAKDAGSEAVYSWLPGHSPDDIQLAQCPEWLIKELKAPAKKPKVDSLIVIDPNQANADVVDPPYSGQQTFPMFKSLQDFILVKLRIVPSKLDKIIYYSESETFNVQTTEKLCVFAGRDHTSNHQYLVIRKNGKMIQRCHSKQATCDGKESEEWILPEEVITELHSLIKLSEPISKEIIELAKKEARDHLNVYLKGNENMKMTVLDNKRIGGKLVSFMQGTAKCTNCQIGHLYSDHNDRGFMVKCNRCQFKYPYDEVEDRLPYNVSRFEHLHKYMQVVFNITNNNTINIYNPQDLEIGWNEFVHDPITVVSDPVLNKTLLKAMSGTHSRMADLLAALKTDQIVFCDENGTKSWYFFNELNGWKSGTDTDIKMILRSDEFLEYFVKVQNQLKSSKSIDKAEAKAKQVAGILTKLETDGYKTSVIHECEGLLKRNKFFDKLDKDKNLLGFDNGVYDLNKGQFRPYTSSDLVTMSVGYDYDPVKMYQDEATIQEINQFMFSVFPDPETCKYVIKFLASCLAGYADDQLFHFGHGSGSNGKGVLIKLMLETIGQYGGTLAASFLTGKTPDADSPTPALTQIVGSRFVAISETVEGAKINEQLFKSLCGQDKMVYRPMRQEARVFEPDFKLFMVLNQLLPFKASDYAMVRRIRVIPFVSSFKENPDIESGEFELDKTLHNRVKGWKHAFMGLLLSGYELYKTEGLSASDQIVKATKAYEKENDLYVQFCYEMCETTPGKSTQVTAFSKSYAEWYKKKFGHDLRIPVSNHTSYLEKVLTKEPWFVEKYKNSVHYFRDLSLRGDQSLEQL